MINLILVVLLSSMMVFGQNPITPSFPTNVLTDSDLLVAGNRAQSILSSTINNSTLTINVINGASFKNFSTITIDDEIIKICSKSGNTLTVCSGGRGFDGTTAASHNAGRVVSGTIVAAYTNTLAANLKNVGNYLRSNVKTPEITGAVGDGVADDTTPLQNIINALNPYDVLDGRGKTYRTGPLTLKSNITLQNFNFVKIAGSTNESSVLTIDGRTQSPYSQTAKTNIGLVNINIDGARASETNITVPSVEDGSRHGIRIVGRVSKVRILNVSVNGAAGDGILISGWHDTNSDAEGSLPIQDISISDSFFTNNRRHGIMIDGASRVRISNTRITGNGTILAGELTTTNGNYCALDNTDCFATGIWFENDLNALGGSLANITVENSYIANNYARSIYFFSNSIPTLSNFVPKNKIIVSNTYMDRGTVNVSGNDIAFQMTYPGVNDGTGTFYEDVQLIGNNINGLVHLRGVDKFLLSGGRLKPVVSSIGAYEYSDNLIISPDTQRGSLTFSSVGNLKPSGVGSTVINYGSSSSSVAVEGAITGSTEGGVIFSSSGLIKQDAAVFLWDFTNKRLGLGVSAPANTLHVRNSGTGIRSDITGVTNGSSPSIYDFYGSSSAVPGTYSRFGGIFGNYTTGSKSEFGLFSDATQLSLSALGTNPIVFRTNSVDRLRINLSGEFEQYNGSAWIPYGLNGPIVVGSLPTASTVTNKVYLVTDGASASDCTIGGGAVRALCVSDGAVWTSLGGTGGGGGGGGYDTIRIGGVAVTQRSIMDYVGTSDISWNITDQTTNTRIQALIDSTKWATRAMIPGSLDKYLTSTGTSTAYVATISGNPITAYATGQDFNWLVHTASGTNPTIAVNGLTPAKKLYMQDGTTQISSGQLPTNFLARIVYDETLDATNGGFRVTNLVPTGVGGDVVGPPSSVSGNIATYANGTGKLLADSGKAVPSGTIVGTTDTQTIENKTLTTPVILSYTVATLPTAGTANRTAYVTDAATSGSCTSGGGSFVVLCRDTGTIWAPTTVVSSGGGGALFKQWYKSAYQNAGVSGSALLAANGLAIREFAIGTNESWNYALGMGTGGLRLIYIEAPVPSGFTTMSFTIYSGLEASTFGTGTYVLDVATACVTPGTDSMRTPSWNAYQPNTITISTSNRQNRTVVTLDSTGCAANDLLLIRTRRDTTVNATDTAVDNVLFHGALLEIN